MHVKYTKGLAASGPWEENKELLLSRHNHKLSWLESNAKKLCLLRVPLLVQMTGSERCHIMSPTTEKTPLSMVGQQQCPSSWRSTYSLDVRLLKWQWHNASLSNTHLLPLPPQLPPMYSRSFIGKNVMKMSEDHQIVSHIISKGT